MLLCWVQIDGVSAFMSSRRGNFPATPNFSFLSPPRDQVRNQSSPSPSPLSSPRPFILSILLPASRSPLSPWLPLPALPRICCDAAGFLHPSCLWCPSTRPFRSPLRTRFKSHPRWPSRHVTHGLQITTSKAACAGSSHTTIPITLTARSAGGAESWWISSSRNFAIVQPSTTYALLFCSCSSKHWMLI